MQDYVVIHELKQDIPVYARLTRVVQLAGCMHGLSEDSPLPAPIVPDDYELGFFNYITGYGFHALSKSQSMNLLQVVPGEGKTVRTLMSGRFPAIPAAETPTHIVSHCLAADHCIRPVPGN